MLQKVLKDCLPTMFSLMMTSLYTVIDGLFIGNQVGDVGLAAINIAWPINAIITALGVGIGIGGSVFLSHKRGLGDEEAGKAIFQTAFSLLVVTPLVLMALLLPCYPWLLTLLGAQGETYLQAEDYASVILLGSLFQMFAAGIVPILRNYNRSFLAMMCMMMGTVVNIIANYFFIYVFDWGLRGAAMGTVLAQFVVSFLAVGVLVLHLKLPLKFHLDGFILKRILTIGATGFGVSLAPSISLMVTNWQCLAYGGDSTVACYCVIAYIVFPGQAILTGIGDGTQPLMSFYAGAQQTQSLKEVTSIAKKVGVVCSLSLTALVTFLSPSIPVWFGLSPTATALFAQGLPIYLVSYLLVFFVKFHLCYLTACLRCTQAIAFTFLESLVITPLLLFLLPEFFQITGIWLSYPVSAVTLLLLFFLTHWVTLRKEQKETEPSLL